jgi:GT2 family glycosyltransferase
VTGVARPSLSIVIPAYRSERTIEASLRSFTAQSYPAEVVVVDSSPDERTAEIVQRVPGVVLIRSGKRLLPHAARNAGARATSGELLLFTDPDIYAEEGAVEALVEAWERHGGAVVAALACHGTSWLERGLHLAKFDLWLAGSPGRALEVGPTSGLLCPRQAFEQVGGFRDDLMLGDTVFSWGLREAGIPIRLEPRAIFRHDHVQRWPDLMRERFARGREFGGLRRPSGDSAARKAYDVAATLTLVRPARVAWRAASNARRAGLARDAVLTLPIVVGGTLAWFAGELTALLPTPRGGKR